MRRSFVLVLGNHKGSFLEAYRVFAREGLDVVRASYNKVIDVHTSLVPPTRSEFHVGYFLPGTSQVVYSGGPRTATAGDGRTVAWPQLRIHDDTTDADVVVPGTDAPLAWHPTPSGDMPNGRFLERFIHGTGATT